MLYLLDSWLEISCLCVCVCGGGEGCFLISNVFENSYEIMNRIQLFDQRMLT